jgi:hypothetical protein
VQKKNTKPSLLKGTVYRDAKGGRILKVFIKGRGAEFFSKFRQPRSVSTLRSFPAPPSSLIVDSARRSSSGFSLLFFGKCATTNSESAPNGAVIFFDYHQNFYQKEEAQ